MHPNSPLRTLAADRSSSIANRFSRKAIFPIWVSVAFIGAFPCRFARHRTPPPPPGGISLLKSPDLGSLTLDLGKEYQGKQSAELLWLFEKVQGVWSLEGGISSFASVHPVRKNPKPCPRSSSIPETMVPGKLSKGASSTQTGRSSSPNTPGNLPMPKKHRPWRF